MTHRNHESHKPGVLIHVVAGPQCRVPLSIALRKGLKYLLKACGLVCVAVTEVGTEASDAPAAQPTPAAAIVEGTHE